MEAIFYTENVNIQYPELRSFKHQMFTPLAYGRAGNMYYFYGLLEPHQKGKTGSTLSGVDVLSRVSLHLINTRSYIDTLRKFSKTLNISYENVDVDIPTISGNKSTLYTAVHDTFNEQKDVQGGIFVSSCGSFEMYIWIDGPFSWTT